MTDFPTGLRMARAGDEARIFALFLVAHAENGYGDVDEEHVKAVIARACVGDRVVIAVAEGPERIEAAIGLHPEKRWYSSNDQKNYYSSDLLIYVHPLHRRSRHAVKLFQFAKYWGEQTKIPVILGLMPKDDFEEKERMFERYGQRVGALFMIGGEDDWPRQVGTS